MSEWVERAPEHVDSLDSALPHFLTSQCRLLAEHYRDVLASNGGQVPDKDALDLPRLAKVLPDLALTAISKPDRCIYRIAGERLKQRIGLNPTGRNYYDFVPEERRAIAARIMHLVIDQPLSFRVEMEQLFDTGMVQIIEAIAVPLTTKEPGVDGFILFVDRQVANVDVLSPGQGTILGNNIRRRELIDLGFGIDREFVDWVRRGTY